MKLSRITQGAVALGFVLSACSHIMPPSKETAASGPGKAAPKVTAAVSDLESAIAVAQTQRRMGDFDGATRTLGQLVLIAPDDPRVLSEYGKTLLDKGATDDALAFLRRATELKPTDWTLFSAQGVAYAQKGMFAAADAAFKHALQMKPGDATILNNHAMARLQAGDIAGAEALLAEAARAGGEHPRIGQNLAMVQRLKSAALEAEANGVAAPHVAFQPTQAAVVRAPAAAEAPAVASAEQETATGVSLPQPVTQSTLPAPALATSSVAAALPASTSTAKAAAKPPAAKQADAKAPAGAAPKPKLATRSPVFVQVASFSSEEDASRVLRRLDGLEARVMPGSKDGRSFFRVRIGPLQTPEEAEATLKRVQELGFRDGFMLAAQPQMPALASSAGRPAPPPLRLAPATR